MKARLFGFLAALLLCLASEASQARALHRLCTWTCAVGPGGSAMHVLSSSACEELCIARCGEALCDGFTYFP